MIDKISDPEHDCKVNLYKELKFFEPVTYKLEKNDFFYLFFCFTYLFICHVCEKSCFLFKFSFM